MLVLLSIKSNQHTIRVTQIKQDMCNALPSTCIEHLL